MSCVMSNKVLKDKERSWGALTTTVEEDLRSEDNEPQRDPE